MQLENGATYSKAVGILLANLLLNANNKTDIAAGTITIGKNQVTIADAVNALLTGELTLNGNNVKGTTGTITLADGTVVEVPSTE
jgi:hypothetical protein